MAPVKKSEPNSSAVKLGSQSLSPWRKWPACVAVACAMIFAICLAWRPISSNDMGYHLAYGDTFLETGRIVDGDDFLYVRADPAKLDVAPGNRPPGAWIDSAGRYRFPNANYGSQVLMSLVYRAGGFTGLCVLQATLVAIVRVLCALTMRRLGVAQVWTAGAILLIAMVGYARFDLRPEVFGYVFLAAIALMISSPRLTRRAIVALVVAHWAAVQVHSYWLLGLSLVGAFWAEAMLGWLRARLKRTQSPQPDREHLRSLTIALGSMVVVTFLNPWTWRLAALPVQTILFLRANEIPIDPAEATVRHPWAVIGEFFRPFQGVVYATRTTYAYFVVLVLSGLGATAAFWRGRWARMAIMAAMVVISLQMRRNLASAALILVPLALASLTDAFRAACSKRLGARIARWTPIAAMAGAAAVILLAGYWTASVVTDRFYYVERRPWRFGPGHAAWQIPIDASQRLPHLPRDVGVFTGYNVSSTVLYFSRDARGFRRMPILTNTWAYPARTTMALNLNLCVGRPHRDGQPDFSRFEKFAVEYGVGIVVLDCNAPNAPLVKHLLTRQWQWVHFDGRNVLLLRADQPVPEALREKRSLKQIIEGIRGREPLPAYSLHVMAVSFHRLGLDQQAEQCWRACVQDDPSYHEAWMMLGRMLYEQAIHMPPEKPRRPTLIEAAECLGKALEIRPDYARARSSLDDVEAALKRARR